MFQTDAARTSNRWPVVRINAQSRTEIILLSDAFFPLSTHWHRATVPCCVDDCALCEFLPSRGLYYLAAMCMSRLSIVELGGQSAGHLEQHCKLLHGGMTPGLKIELSRRSPKQPVFSEVVGRSTSVSNVTMLDLANHVMALYKLPCANPDESLADYAVRLQRVVRVRNERFAMNLKTSKPRGF